MTVEIHRRCTGGFNYRGGKFRYRDALVAHDVWPATMTGDAPIIDAGAAIASVACRRRGIEEVRK